jgi:hypothetical protein
VGSWRILLGGVASASVLGVGVAAPTLTRPVSHARDLSVSSLTQVLPVSSLTQVLPVSSLTRVVPASPLTRVAPRASVTHREGCDLPGLPEAGPVVSALAGALGAPCGSSDTPGGSWSNLVGAGSSAALGGKANTSGRATRMRPARPATTSMLPGLSAVTSAIPGLFALTSMVPGPSTAGPVTAGPVTAGPVTGRPAGAGPLTGALWSLGGAFGGAQLGSQQP